MSKMSEKMDQEREEQTNKMLRFSDLIRRVNYKGGGDGEYGGKWLTVVVKVRTI